MPPSDGFDLRAAVSDLCDFWECIDFVVIISSNELVLVFGTFTYEIDFPLGVRTTRSVPSPVGRLLGVTFVRAIVIYRLIECRLVQDCGFGVVSQLMHVTPLASSMQQGLCIMMSAVPSSVHSLHATPESSFKQHLWRANSLIGANLPCLFSSTPFRALSSRAYC